ncbi:MAG: hypothetical protein PHU88_00540 [candidate division Zixibacteria bacterium]|nr:hypothetical protein [candidate division Zixibacteria bacterium]MDD5427511.1 hypothetical protein [candidate division Zixibacteria bacterium]
MLAVGDSARLEVFFATSYYRGLIIKRPALFTNEADSVRRFRIETEVVINPDSTFPLVISPYKLNLYRMADDLEDSMTFEITNVADMIISLNVIDLADDLMELHLDKHLNAGEKIRGVVRLKEAAFDSTFDKSITLGIEGKENLRFTIPVSRRIIQ